MIAVQGSRARIALLVTAGAVGVTQIATGAAGRAAAAPGPPGAPAAAQASGYHVDERLGFKLKPPRGWTQIPLKVDEEWLVAKYLSDKTYLYNDPDTGWDWEHRPELMVIAFVERKPGEEPLAGEEGEEVEIVVDTPYASYEDYLDRTYTGGGFYVDSKEDGEQNGTPVTRLEIKVEKLAMTGPKLISTWIYHLEGLDLAVQVEVLQEVHPKLKRTVEGALQSFQKLPRKAGALPTQVKTDEWITITMMEEGTPEERRQRRLASELQRRERAQQGLPDGWTAQSLGRCFVLNHADERYAKEVVAQVDALLAWLERTLPFVGPESYVREPILRICADEEEHASFRRGRMGGDAWWGGSGSEIVTYKASDGWDWSDFKLQTMNSQVFNHWFSERDLRLYWALPQWVRWGLDDYVGQARLKGKTLEFGVDLWIKEELRKLVRDGTATQPREIMHLSNESFWSGTSAWNRKNEAAALVHFFLSGKASKNRRTKDVFPRYVENLQAIIKEIEAERGAAEPEDGPRERPESEEEEDRWYKERQESWKQAEGRILEEAFQRTFGGWSAADWDEFAKVYFDSID